MVVIERTVFRKFPENNNFSNYTVDGMFCNNGGSAIPFSVL